MLTFVPLAKTHFNSKISWRESLDVSNKVDIARFPLRYTTIFHLTDIYIQADFETTVGMSTSVYYWSKFCRKNGSVENK